MKFEVTFISVQTDQTARGSLRIKESVFWDEAEQKLEGISRAKGCYIFGLCRSGGAPKPWYIGKATKSFKSEVFTYRNKGIYRDCIDDTKRGVPVLILLTAKTEKGSIAQGNNALKETIDWVETHLIQAALKRNSNLKNLQKTNYLKKVVIPGLLNSGRGNDGEDGNALRKMFKGIKKQRQKPIGF